MGRLLHPLAKPFPGKWASSPAHPVVLDLVEQSALNRIARSGAQGVAIGDGLLITTAIRLALFGRIKIVRGDPTVCVLSNGRA